MERLRLARAIRQWREEKGLTIAEVSKMAGMHFSALYRIEKGQRFPKPETLRKLAKPLGFTEVELFKLAGFLSVDESELRLFKLAGYL